MYIVQNRLYNDNWESWVNDDETPIIFKTKTEALEEITDTVQTSLDSFNLGYLFEPYKKSDFRIIKLGKE
tara:strand:+ start:386 stop:595 length:210 start_codon:yes stop_codon:yes gene_type:complete